MGIEERFSQVVLAEELTVMGFSIKKQVVEKFSGEGQFVDESSASFMLRNFLPWRELPEGDLISGKEVDVYGWQGLC
ncbi:unnamed protein product [Toxocara canis]|uniref:Calpain catalytic domain-containing protein n=1 Tax=Toxocara canis TaxID=6265 RepID=A0A183V922_TOXCA|nr:unnamed protein product [Toxocara canis]